MNIINFDVKEPEENVHHFLLPNSIRCIIFGPSSCGKTNLMLNLLLTDGYLNYDRLCIYSKSLDQDKYRLVKQWSDCLKDVAKFYLSQDEIVPVNKNDKKHRTVVVFDDVMLANQKPMAEYFTQGRHYNVDCFYLVQSFFEVPKHTVRDNANLLVMFHQDLNNQRAIHNTYVGGDMEWEEFASFFKQCTLDRFSFCVIDLTSEPFNGRYRRGFDEFYVPRLYINVYPHQRPCC
jgi:hypothetical protein